MSLSREAIRAGAPGLDLKAAAAAHIAEMRHNDVMEVLFDELMAEVERLRAALAAVSESEPQPQIVDYYSKTGDVVAVSPVETPQDVCEWVLEDEDSTDYRASCGRIFMFNDGTPAENHAKFCIYCGKRLQVARPVCSTEEPR